MPGLYVHIPFCARRCPYCDFAIHIGAKPAFVGEYVAALRTELQNILQAYSAAGGAPLSTIFFGGGTPTFLEAADLTGLMRLIRDNVAIEPDAEISSEANPDGLTEEKLCAMREAGWNRLSLGVQSFDDEALLRIGRTHRAADIESVFKAARRAGFANISLDLMFALPGQSRESWRETLARALELGPEHLSCYSLTIEEGTPFARRVERGQLLPIADDMQADLMEDADRITRAAGVERYEVSNYARPGFECRHNLNYWRGGDYLAAGCGAHGHKDGHRWWNERDAGNYVVKIQQEGAAAVGEEHLTPQQRLNEIVMLGLRLREGFSLQETSERLKIDAKRELNGALTELMESGVVVQRSGSLALAPEALVVADAVAARLMR